MIQMHIKKNKKPALPLCNFSCDSRLDPKLDEFDLTKFMNCHSVNLVIGKPGSGKTNLLFSLFKSKKLFKRVYDKVFLFQPSLSRASMKDKLFDSLPEDQKYDELTLENLQYVNDMLEVDGNNCIIMDDMGAYLKDNSTRKLLKEMVYNRRHKHLSIFFLVQTWFSVEKDLRKLFSNMFIFRVSKNELSNIFEETIEQKKEIITDLSKLVYDVPYNFLFVNTDSGRMFKNFDEIIID
jgi:AAA15 family ATPase/GTPase